MLELIVMGVVQGLTEWLPLSSKSQVALAAMTFFGMQAETAFRIALFAHIGTLLAALVYFLKPILELPKNRKLLADLVAATATTAAIGLPLYLLSKKAFAAFDAHLFMIAVGAGLVFTALLLGVKPKGLRKLGEINMKDAVFTGALQALSVLPGVSRSGTTTAALLLRNVKTEDALKFSFMLSIPAVAGAEVGLSLLEGLPPISAAEMLVLTASSFIAGFLSLEALMLIARRIEFSWFCLLLGALAIAAGILGG
ncbi:undecaprenyl-diphosphate phosphatase [Candidatus Micrarchaeota archaeon]|nr:undecaprenyl-diphosphate phosphatase [Candidatus Micrarchaeota archaeon]